jgi:hypothetical protein
MNDLLRGALRLIIYRNTEAIGKYLLKRFELKRFRQVVVI